MDQANTPFVNSTCQSFVPKYLSGSPIDLAFIGKYLLKLQI
jgi:hypothetical protein